MPLLRHLFLALFTLVCVALPAAQADTLSIRADSWPPYNAGPKEVKPGYMIEVLREIFTPLGHSIDYRLLSWEESLAAVRAGRCIAVVGASRDDAPDFVFPTEPLGMSGTTFFTARTGNWKFTGIDSLKSVRLGVVEGYAYDGELDNYIRAQKGSGRVVSVGGDDPVPQLIRLLRAGKIDVVAEDPAVMIHTLVSSSIPAGAVHGAGRIGDRSPLYVAFSPAAKKSKEYARIFDEGLIRMRADGRLQAILARYGLYDWK